MPPLDAEAEGWAAEVGCWAGMVMLEVVEGVWARHKNAVVRASSRGEAQLRSGHASEIAITRKGAGGVNYTSEIRSGDVMRAHGWPCSSLHRLSSLHPGRLKPRRVSMVVYNRPCLKCASGSVIDLAVAYARRGARQVARPGV